MVRHRIDTISQIMGQDYWIRVLCRCGNNTTVDPGKLLFARKVSLKTTVDQLRGMFVCKLCRARPYDVHATFKPEK